MNRKTKRTFFASAKRYLFEYKSKRKFEALKVADSDQTLEVPTDVQAGDPAYISTTDGSVEAPNGTYELENGNTITVEGGEVANVEEGGEEFEEEKEGEEKEEFADGDVSGQLASLREEVNALKAAFEELKNSIPTPEIMETVVNAIDEVQSEVDEVKEVLSETPAEFTKVNKSVEAQNEKFAKINRLQKLHSKIG